MKKILIILSILVLSIFISTKKAKALTPLDKILEYNITVTPNTDATLDMVYNIKWKVLNDSIDGPLTWVKIGVPNTYVSNIKNLSPDVVRDVNRDKY